MGFLKFGEKKKVDEILNSGELAKVQDIKMELEKFRFTWGFNYYHYLNYFLEKEEFAKEIGKLGDLANKNRNIYIGFKSIVDEVLKEKDIRVDLSDKISDIAYANSERGQKEKR